jgi:peroxin-2
MSPNDSNKNEAEKSIDGSVANTKAFWRKDWLNVQSPLFSLRRSLASFPSSPLRIMQVSQLDADLLDTDLFETFKEQLWLLFSVNTSTFIVLCILIIC